MNKISTNSLVFIFALIAAWGMANQTYAQCTPPVPTIYPSDGTCISVAHYYSTESGMSNYVWSFSPDATVIAGGTATSNWVGVNWGSVGVKTVSISYTQNGCPATSPTVQNFTITVPPTATLTGTTDACDDENYSVYTYVTEPGMGTYIYNFSPAAFVYVYTTDGSVFQTQDGWNISGTLTNSPNTIKVRWNSTGNKFVKVTYYTPDGCMATVTKNIVVHPRPVPTLTGPTSFCANTNGLVYTTEPGKTNYIWSVPNHFTIAAGGSSSDNTISLNSLDYGGGDLTVWYTDTYGCVGYSSLNIQNYGAPTKNISGNNLVCDPNSENVYTTDAGMSNYTWTVSSKGTITSGGTSTSNTVTVKWDKPGQAYQTVTVMYTYANGCRSGNPVYTNVNTFIAPTVNSGTACLGIPLTYYTQSGMSNYTWTIGPGATINSGGGSTNDNVTITWNTVGSRTISVNYTTPAGCRAPTPTVGTINVPSATVSTITGSQNLCLNGASNYYTVSNGTNYIWTVDYNSTITQYPQTGAQFLTSGNHMVGVRFTDQYGCPSIPNTLTINVSPYPTGTTQTLPYINSMYRTFGDVPFNLSVTSNRGLPASFSSTNPAVASISGNTVTITGGGSCIITASQPGNGCITAAANSSFTLSVARANQTITFNPLTPVQPGSAPITLNATSSVGLPVSYASSNTAVATVSGNVLTIVGPGSSNITASQPGNTNYNPAANVVQTLVVNKINPVISFTSSNTGTYLGSIALSINTGGSTGAVTYSVANGTGTATTSGTGGSTLNLTGVGQVTVTVSVAADVIYNAATATQTVTISKANPVFTITSPNTGTYGSPIILASNGGGSTGSISYSVVNGTGSAIVAVPRLLLTGAGTVTLTATIAADANYNSGSASQIITINKASQTITFGALPSLCGIGSFSLGAYSTSGLPITYSSSNTAVVTISGTTGYANAYGSATITASQPGDGNYYAAANVQQGVSIMSPTGTISASPSANICTYGYANITAGPGSNYAWNTGESSRQIFVTDAGMYSVNYMNAYGCWVSVSINIRRQGSYCNNLRIAQDDPAATDPNLGSDPNHLFGVSPNPATHEILVVLSAPSAEDSPVQFFDMLGRERKFDFIDKGLKEKTIPVSDLEPGTYLINIKDAKGFRQRKLIIQRK